MAYDNKHNVNNKKMTSSNDFFDFLQKENLLVFTVYITRVYSLILLGLGLLILVLKHFTFSDNSLLDSLRTTLINNGIFDRIIMPLHNVTLILTYFKPVSDFIYSLNFTALINLYFDKVNLIDISNLKILGAIGLFIGFSYLLVEIKEKGVLAKDIENLDFSNPLTYLTIMLQYFAFYLIISLVMFAYLLNQLKIFEFASYLLMIVLFSFSIVIYLLTVSNLYSYDSLENLNTKTAQIKFRSIALTDKQIKRNMIEALSNKLQRNIILLIFEWLLIAYFLSFNVISVLFITAAFTISYYYISLIKHLPNSKANIFLNCTVKNTNTDNSIKDAYTNVFITQEFPSKDYIEIITSSTKDNEQIKIMKSSIAQIKYIVYENDEGNPSPPDFR